MGRLIDTNWTCSLCLSENHVRVVKPRPYSQTICWQTCEVCDSKFLMQFRIVLRGRPMEGPEGDIGDRQELQKSVSINTIKVTPSKDGLDQFHKRETKTNPALPDQPKGP